jgi:coenzyme F420-reducing hydrogenase gamma subunit
MSKPKVAFFDFTCCEGCQLTVVDSLQTHPELLDAVEIVQFREAMSEKGEDYLIAFVEGSLARPADEERLRGIREKAAVLVALGACAHLGGINTIRNRQPLQQVREYVYGEKWDWFDAYEARPISAAVKVDYFIPGCPIDRNEFLAVVTALLQGREPKLPDYPMCVECKLKENVCMYDKDKTCIGPVTRAGCGAICPTYGDGCEGCRGLISNPNLNAAEDVLKEHGLTVKEIMDKMDLFGTYQMMEMDGVSYD